ncbi:MAG: hypothetical protein HZB33_07260 [Nitrospirae bacterium]|nr:hypothetical protein [Nitrospirota bacterium]
MPSARGKSLKALIRDVADGYVAVNPLFLKSFEPEVLKEFYGEISRVQNDIRLERFPSHDTNAIRLRNVKLQRLYSASMIIRNYARERRFMLV